MKIGVVGCAGRMGQMLMRQVLDTDGARLSGGTERPGSDKLGQDLGTLLGRDAIGVPVTDDAEALFRDSDAVIDFTAPVATLKHAALAAANDCALIVGTTGFTAEELATLKTFSDKAVIVQEYNMSVGVNLLFKLVEQVSGILDPEYDIEIVEMHHKHKVDAPSGTAIGLGNAAARGRKVALEEAAVRVRDGITGPREEGTIGFATLRGGDVVGDHTVIYAGPGERIELTHKASSREIFARGAVRAALWSTKAKPGYYGMAEVLGF